MVYSIMSYELEGKKTDAANFFYSYFGEVLNIKEPEI